MFVKCAASTFIVFVIMLSWAAFSLGQEEVVLEIVREDMLDGYPGYIQEMEVFSTAWETDFLFEENGFIRWYAYKMAWEQTFTVLPDSSYIVRTDELVIGDTWRSWAYESTIAEVVDTVTVTVPAGTYFTYVINHYSESQPGDIVAIQWLAFDVGIVKVELELYTTGLYEFQKAGGTGFYPLCVGNRWTLGPFTEGIEGDSDESRGGKGTPASLPCRLSQNHPNPFNPTTTLQYSLSKAGDVSLTIFDARGGVVERLVNGYRSAGVHSVTWNAVGAGSGVYLYRIESGGFTDVKKCIIMK